MGQLYKTANKLIEITNYMFIAGKEWCNPDYSLYDVQIYLEYTQITNYTYVTRR